MSGRRDSPGTGARVLLVGGSGFMGRPAARALRAAGHHVTVMSRGARPVPEADEVITAEREDPASIAAALEHGHFDLTVDFLAYDAGDVERLLTVPHASLGRYVLISTGQVYMVGEGVAPPFREQARDSPLSPEPPAGSANSQEWTYGAGKRRAEQSLRTLAATHGVRSTSLRLPIVQGEGDGTLRLWAWLERMQDGGPLLLPEGGTRPVRFLWSEDLARALVRLLEDPPPASPAFNLAQPDVIPLRSFLELAARAAGFTPRFVDASFEEIDAAGIERIAFPYSSRWVSVLDPSLAEAELGFAATPATEYLPGVVRAHLERPPQEHHPGLSQRARELELAASLAARAAP